MQQKTMQAVWLGRIAYREAFDLQTRLHHARLNEEIPDTVLFLEHDHVITLGKRADDADILLPEKELNERGFDVVRTTRGGQVTYHGPGQLVVYFVFNLYHAERELRRFVENLENATISYLKTRWGIGSRIDPDNPGVWVGNNKIAALGIAVSQRVTTHGLSLNVTPDLSSYRYIVSCGFKDRGQLSIEAITGSKPGLEEVSRDFLEILVKTYGYESCSWTDKSLLDRSTVSSPK